MITSRAMPAPLPHRHRRVANCPHYSRLRHCRPPASAPLVTLAIWSCRKVMAEYALYLKR